MFEQSLGFRYLKAATFYPVSAETKKQPPLLGLIWPYEVPFVALIAYGFYETSPDFRGSPWPVCWFGAAVVAGIVLLAGRCAEQWRALPNKLFFFALAAVWTALFTCLGNSTFGYLDSNSIFAWAFDIYTTPLGDAQYGLFMPFAILGLLWWKRAELTAQPLQLWWPGIFLVAAGLLAHLVGYIIQQPRLSLVGFLTGLYGLTGLAWGKHWLRASWFPFFLVVFCIPPGGTDWLTLRMRLTVSWTVEHIAHLGLAPDLVRDGTQLMDGEHHFSYEVAEACSGIRSLTALLALTTIYSFMNFKSPWRRAVMIGAAFPLSMIGNVARLCFTIIVAEVGGQSAGKAVETKAGLVTFAVAIGLVYVLGVWLDEHKKQKQPPEPQP